MRLAQSKQETFAGDWKNGEEDEAARQLRVLARNNKQLLDLGLARETRGDPESRAFSASGTESSNDTTEEKKARRNPVRNQ
jgi:hypothetical protein